MHSYFENIFFISYEMGKESYLLALSVTFVSFSLTIQERSAIDCLMLVKCIKIEKELTEANPPRGAAFLAPYVLSFTYCQKKCLCYTRGLLLG